MRIYPLSVLSFICLLMNFTWHGLGQAESLRVEGLNDRVVGWLGEKLEFEVIVFNAGPEHVGVDTSLEIFQGAASTAVPLGKVAWKHLELDGGIRLVETVHILLPETRAATLFLIRFVTGKGEVLGVVKAWGHPRNLLADGKGMLSGRKLGLCGVGEEFKRVLKDQGWVFDEVSSNRLGDYSGELLVVGMGGVKDAEISGLTRKLIGLARKGKRVVWIHRYGVQEGEWIPNFQIEIAKPGSLISAHEELLKELETNPLSQLNLVRLLGMALVPEPVSALKQKD